MRFLIAVRFLLLGLSPAFFSTTYAQTLKNTLRLQGKVVEGKERLQGVQIILYSEGEEVDRFTTADNGRFKYLLPLEKNYDMVFYKSGYRSKYVRILAKYIPEEDAAFGFEFGGLELGLFKEIKNLQAESVLDQPMAQIVYDTNIYKFVFDASYFQEVEQQVAQLNQELAVLEENPVELQKKQQEAERAVLEERKKLDEDALLAMKKQSIQSPELNSKSINTTFTTPSLTPITKKDSVIVRSEEPKVVLAKSQPISNSETKKPAISKETHQNQVIKTPAKPSVMQETKPTFVAKADKNGLLSKNIYRQGNKTITDIQIQQQGMTIKYKRVIADWGGKYYFKDETPITSVTWETDLEPFENELK